MNRADKWTPQKQIMHKVWNYNQITQSWYVFELGEILLLGGMELQMDGGIKK